MPIAAFWSFITKDSVGNVFSEESTEFPPSLTVPLTLKQKLRYGENPHQRAAFYEDKSLCEFGAGGIATAVQYHGKVSTSGLVVLWITVRGSPLCIRTLCNTVSCGIMAVED